MDGVANPGEADWFSVELMGDSARVVGCLPPTTISFEVDLVAFDHVLQAIIVHHLRCNAEGHSLVCGVTSTALGIGRTVTVQRSPAMAREALHSLFQTDEGLTNLTDRDSLTATAERWTSAKLEQAVLRPARTLLAQSPRATNRQREVGASLIHHQETVAALVSCISFEPMRTDLLHLQKRIEVAVAANDRQLHLQSLDAIRSLTEASNRLAAIEQQRADLQAADAERDRNLSRRLNLLLPPVTIATVWSAVFGSTRPVAAGLTLLVLSITGIALISRSQTDHKPRSPEHP